jgi:uncharacterized protein YjbI with pentapeptide repeats
VLVGLLIGACRAALAIAEPADQERPADITAEEVQHILIRSDPDHPADLSGRSLKNLDLSHMKLAGANLSGANLFGAKLDGADLHGANLRNANLNLSWLIHADFTGADLTDASLVAPVVAEGLVVKSGEIPIFKDAILTGARVQARFTGGDLRGAKFGRADMSAHMTNQSMGLMRSEMGSVNLEGADFSNANLGHALLTFANLKNVNFTGADLRDADLTGADATGADFTGADLREAILDDAKLDGAKGFDKPAGPVPDATK